jgi:hypothetical protein
MAIIFNMSTSDSERLAGQLTVGRKYARGVKFAG